MTSDERKARIHERTMRDPIWRGDADGTMTSPASDGTEDDVDQGCCTDRRDGSCGGYGFAFELAARTLRDGTGHWARLDGTCWVDCPACASDGTERDFFEEDEPLEDVVTAFEGGKPLLTVVDETAGKTTTTASCCGTTICGSGIVGMFAGPGDLARRAKDIARGRPDVL